MTAGDRVRVFGASDDVGVFAPKLTLLPDGTYRYQNLSGSCWLAWDEEGTWQRSGRLITLTSKELEEFWPVRIVSRKDPAVDGIAITLFGAGHVPDAGASLTYGIEGIERRADADGRVVIPAADVTRMPPEARVISFQSGDSTATVLLPPDNVISIQPVRCPRRVVWQRTYFLVIDTGLLGLGGARGHLAELPLQEAAPYRPVKQLDQRVCSSAQTP